MNELKQDIFEENMNEEDENIIEKPTIKPKKKLSQKQLDNLKKGREALAEKKRNQKEKREKAILELDKEDFTIPHEKRYKIQPRKIKKKVVYKYNTESSSSSSDEEYLPPPKRTKKTKSKPKPKPEPEYSSSSSSEEEIIEKRKRSSKKQVSFEDQISEPEQEQFSFV